MRKASHRILIAASILALAGCGEKKEEAAQEPETQVAAEPAEGAAPGAQSSEWVQEPADPKGVKVDLPETSMTNAPAAGGAAETAEKKAD